MAGDAARRSVVVLLVVVGFAAIVAEAKVYTPTDNILVNCGSTADGLDGDGRRWVADTNENTWLSDAGKSSLMAAADEMDPALPSTIPYMTARVFTVEAVYNFTVNPGERHWLRLHFYPACYSGLAADDFHFSVSTSSGLTLLRNFSAYLTGKALTQAFIVREFSLPPSPAGFLSVHFTPMPLGNETYAFVNGIELISMPEIFGDPAIMVGFADQTVDFSSSTLQTMYRLNVGGSQMVIPPSNDSGLTRTWYDDTPYVFGPTQGVVFQAGPHFHVAYTSDTAEYAAPPEVYKGTRSMGSDPRVNQNYNLTWTMRVDGNFTYVARLHFCELLLTRPNQRSFDIYVNNRTAQADADVIGMTNGRGVPMFKDFAVHVADEPGDDEAVWVALHPSVALRPQFYDAILNGLEVFKLNDSSGNLAAPNPEPSRLLAKAEMGPGDHGTHHHEARDAADDAEERQHKMAWVMGGTAGGAAVLGIFAAVCVAVYHDRKNLRREASGGSHASGACGCRCTTPTPAASRRATWAGPTWRACAATSHSRKSSLPPRTSARRWSSAWAGSGRCTAAWLTGTSRWPSSGPTRPPNRACTSSRRRWRCCPSCATGTWSRSSASARTRAR